MQATEDVALAVSRLRRAAEKELEGNSYYLISGQIAEIGELLKLNAGAGNEPVSSGAQNFPEALAELRNRVDGGLSGNAYYMVSHKLDVIGYLAGAYPQAAQVARRSAPELSAKATRSFDDLAAASKKRLDEVSAAFGIRTHQTPPTMIKSEVLADGELERRSSEPCFAGSIEVSEIQPLDTAAFSPEAREAAGRPTAQTDLGFSPTESRPVGSGAQDERAAAKTASEEEAALAAAPAHDRKAPPAGETLEQAQEAAKTGAAKPGLFELWLDMIFGKRRS